MSDYVDVMEFGLKPTGEIVVMIGEKGEASSLQDLLALAPDASPLNWAKVLNELEYSGAFTVIADPEGYQRDYIGQIEAEDPGQPWQEGVIRLRDFGMPDFSQISTPSISGGHLVYFVSDDTTGLPYRAEADLAPGSAAPVYAPLDLSPMQDPPAPVTAKPANPDVAAAEAEEGARKAD